MNLQVYTPDSDFNYGYVYPTKLFIAGSIEQGKATDWQTKVIETFRLYNLALYNPRRAKWNPELEQSFKTPVFNDQVVWEQEKLIGATHVLVNFEQDTYSPITIGEFYQICGMANKPKTVVVCPKSFWRVGNIEIMCILNGIPLYTTLDEGIAHLKTLIKRQ